jgi:hypothetical protein
MVAIKKERSHLPRMRALLVSVTYRVPRRISHLFGNPAILLGQDPWLCVTRSLWFCPFGERFFSLLKSNDYILSMPQRMSTIFFS